MIQNIFSEELIQALGWTMIHSLWQGFAVAILMGLAMIVLQKKSAKIRYEIAWFALFLVFVLSLSTFIYLYDSIAGGEALGTSITVITEGGINIENVEIVQTFFQKTIYYFNEHLPLIVTLWLMGMVFFFLRLLGGIAYVERLKYQKQNQLPKKWQQIFETLRAKFPMKKTVRIAESSLAKVPMVIGYFKPIILFPIGAVNQLSTQEVEAVLAHELAHIYRNDYLLNIIQSIIEIIFYYHPAVWWISANIRTERENCCDDIAVQLCGNSLTYVKALVNLEEIHSAPSLAMSFSSGSKNQLLNRVKRILNQPQNKFNIMEKFTATCFLLGVLLLFSVSATDPIEEETSNEKPVTIDLQNDFDEENTWTNDTVPTPSAPPAPKVKSNGNYMYSDGNENVEVKYENDEIVDLKINGETIPKEEYADYEEHIKELMESIPAPPAPPRRRINTPPSPSSPFIHLRDVPSGTSLNFDGSSKKMVITKDEDGNTIIISDSDEEGEDTHVIIGNGDFKLNGVIINDDELPIILGDEELNNLSPKIAFISEGGITMRTFDEDNLIIPSLAELPEFLEEFDLEELSNIQDFTDLEIPDFPEFEIPDFNFDYNFDTIPFENIWIDGEAVDFDEMSEEEKEEYQTKMKEAKEHLAEAQIKMREGMAKAREINREEMKRQMKEARERMAEAKVHLKEAQERHKEQMAELRQHQKEQQERMEERYAQRREMRTARSIERSKWIAAIETQLKGDGHIKNDGSFKFHLTEDKLKINGKTQSESEWEKYKGLYEMASSKKLSGDYKIKITTDGKNNKNVSVSISEEESH